MQKIIYLFFILCFVGTTTCAQGELPTDLRPQIKTLTDEQKVKVLEYLRRISAPDIDRQIQAAYSQLSPADKTKAVHYTDFLKAEDPQRKVRTTVRWSRDTLFFGNIEEGRIFLDSVTVMNTGDKPYLISGTRTSCDCSVLRYSEFPVMPGEKIVVRIEFDSRNKLGPIVAGIVIYDNSAPNIRSILYVAGEVLPKRPKE
jgi:Protein of unknown function (DUF1573)